MAYEVIAAWKRLAVGPTSGEINIRIIRQLLKPHLMMLMMNYER